MADVLSPCHATSPLGTREERDGPSLVGSDLAIQVFHICTHLYRIQIFKVGFLRSDYDEYHNSTHHDLSVSEFDSRKKIYVSNIHSYPICFHVFFRTTRTDRSSERLVWLTLTRACPVPSPWRLAVSTRNEEASGIPFWPSSPFTYHAPNQDKPILVSIAEGGKGIQGDHGLRRER
jgi:hypothetical protein